MTSYWSIKHTHQYVYTNSFNLHFGYRFYVIKQYSYRTACIDILRVNGLSEVARKSYNLIFLKDYHYQNYQTSDIYNIVRHTNKEMGI